MTNKEQGQLILVNFGCTLSSDQLWQRACDHNTAVCNFFSFCLSWSRIYFFLYHCSAEVSFLVNIAITGYIYPRFFFFLLQCSKAAASAKYQKVFVFFFVFKVLLQNWLSESLGMNCVIYVVVMATVLFMDCLGQSLLFSSVHQRETLRNRFFFTDLLVFHSTMSPPKFTTLITSSCEYMYVTHRV